MRYSCFLVVFLLRRKIEGLIQITGKYSVVKGKAKSSARALGDALGWYLFF